MTATTNIFLRIVSIATALVFFVLILGQGGFIAEAFTLSKTHFKNSGGMMATNNSDGMMATNIWAYISMPSTVVAGQSMGVYAGVGSDDAAQISPATVGYNIVGYGSNSSVLNASGLPLQISWSNSTTITAPSTPGNYTVYILSNIGGGYRSNLAPSATLTVNPNLVNGQCATAVNSCVSGTPAGTGTGNDTATNYIWSCNGSGGGSTVYGCSAPKPINGVCSPTPETCISGSPAWVGPIQDTATTYGWRCVGSNGGTTNFSCSAPKPATPVNGSCGAATNSCNSGSFRDISDTGTLYRWSCDGLNTGNNASCSNNRPVNGSCGAATNSCNSGSFRDISDTGTLYRWSCDGNFGGANDSCSNPIPVIPVPNAPSISGSCSGTSASISFSSPGATYYQYRVDNTTANSWNGSCSSPNSGDLCNNYRVTGSASFTGQTGASYTAWAHACNGTGCSPASGAANFSCPVPNAAPTANAGGNRTITLPTNSVSSLGATASDPDGSIASHSWTRISGPAPATAVNASDYNANFSGLTVAGDYGFRLTVTDNDGATDSGTIIVRVNPAFVPPVVDVDVNLDVVSQGSSVGIVVDIDNLSALNLSCTLQGPGNIQDGGSPISNPFSVLAGTNFTRTFTAGPLNSASVYTLTCNDGVNPAYIDADTVEVVPKIQEI